MHYLIKVPDTAGRDNVEAAKKIHDLLLVSLEYGYTKLADGAYELKIDNDNVRRRKEYRQRRTEKEKKADVSEQIL